jgi:histidinol-phosphate aminotransferase
MFYYMDRNEFQFDLPQKVLDVLKNAHPELLTHYTRDYTKNVKSVISEKIGEIFGVPEPNVLLGYGAEDLLKQMIHYYLDEGSKLLVPENSWWYYQSIADEVGGITIQFPIHKTKTTYRVDVDDLISIYNRQHPQVILIASPNNPTGDGISIEDIEKVLEHCGDSFIALDEAYWGYQSGDNSHVKRFIEKYPNLIILRTFSKYYGLPGVRIGYGFINEANERFIKFANRYLGYNRLSENLALAAMDSEEYYAGIRKIMQADKEKYYSETRQLPGVKVYDTYANFILIEVPEGVSEKIKELLEPQNILIKYLSSGSLKNHLRISLAKVEIGDKVRKAIKEAAAG